MANGPSRIASYLIRRTDFVPMAQQIVQHVPKVTVPMLIEHTFERAISARRRVSNWFKVNHGDQSKHDSDTRHLYFISGARGCIRDT